MWWKQREGELLHLLTVGEPAASTFSAIVHTAVQSPSYPICSTQSQGAGLFPPPPPQIPFLSFTDKHRKTSYLQVSANISEILVLLEPLQIPTMGSLMQPKGRPKATSCSALQDSSWGPARPRKLERFCVVPWRWWDVCVLQILECMYTPHLALLTTTVNQSFQNFYFVFGKFGYINHYFFFLLSKQILLPLSQYLYYSFNIFRKH